MTATITYASAKPTDSGLTVLLDEPLHLHAPETVQARLHAPAFRALLRRERTLTAAVAALEAIPGPDRDSRTWHRVYDAHRAVRAEIAAYRLETAHLLGEPEEQRRQIVPPAGVEGRGEYEPGSVDFLRIRQGSLGGSDVGAICKVGRWGALNCNDVRARHLDPNPAEQDHSGAALVGDLWEPFLVAAVGRILDRPVFVDKQTYASGIRHTNLDGFLPREDGTVEIVVEAKTSSRASDWEDGAPAAYVLQTLHNADILSAGYGLLVVNINDERLVVVAVAPDATVAAGEKTPQKVGDRFGYSGARAYAETLVTKWAAERAAAIVSPSTPTRRTFANDPAFRAAWTAAHERGVVFTDLETTTFSASSGHVIELAMTRDDGEVLHCLYGVPADHLAWNGTGKVEIHGITPEMVAGHRVLLEDDEALAEIVRFVGDRVVVAHNASFEAGFLGAAGLEQVSYADTMRAFGTVVNDPSVTGNTMADLVAWAGQEYHDEHRAWADTEMLAASFELLGPLVWAALEEPVEV